MKQPVDRLDQENGYQIGAVSNLTGISADALRIWEKRYGVPQPKRTKSGNRIYSKEDLTRLSLIKYLLDAGNSIGSLVNLDLETLRARTNQTRLPGIPPGEENYAECRAVVVGLGINMWHHEYGKSLEGVKIIGTFSDLDEVTTTKASPDVLIVDLPVLNDSRVKKIQDCQTMLGASYVIVIYRFGRSNLVKQLNNSHSLTLRAPVETGTLQRHCDAALRKINTNSLNASLELSALAQPLPARQYDDKTLARVAGLSSTLECECPHHLAELVRALNAFEDYSAECENQTSADAALHAYLHSATAQARSQIEQALTHLIEVEQIKL